MPVIRLESNGEFVNEYLLEKGRSLSIGRGEDNDIAIHGTAVSRHHAGIESEGDAFFLTDYQSRNGTFVNQQLVIFRRLSHGDIITIGNQNMVFSYREGEVQPEETVNEIFDMTMPIDTKDHRALLAKGVADMAAGGLKKQSKAVLAFISGGTGEVILEKEVIHIGKDPSSDIIVKGMMIGRVAAVIRKTPKGYSISPAEGLSKPKINYKVLRSETELNEFDVIDVGPVKLQFQFKKT
ncbi:MAG: hypothetical protein A2V65_11705 [Deltaproteobacteria bacterium RBG_13_49_15]|nr:MAG: hypothetical protein A2V65_11705 [Deltaproteobacteria bacterium RBG_13_49_15]